MTFGKQLLMEPFGPVGAARLLMSFDHYDLAICILILGGALGQE
jgi:hypothetical protein